VVVAPPSRSATPAAPPSDTMGRGPAWAVVENMALIDA